MENGRYAIDLFSNLPDEVVRTCTQTKRDKYYWYI